MKLVFALTTNPFSSPRPPMSGLLIGKGSNFHRLSKWYKHRLIGPNSSTNYTARRAFYNSFTLTSNNFHVLGITKSLSVRCITRRSHHTSFMKSLPSLTAQPIPLNLKLNLLFFLRTYNQDVFITWHSTYILRLQQIQTFLTSVLFCTPYIPLNAMSKSAKKSSQTNADLLLSNNLLI